ncbi:MAG: ion channel [Verrucomicrobiota bacterium]
MAIDFGLSREGLAWALLISLIIAFGVGPAIPTGGGPSIFLNIFIAFALITNLAAISDGKRLWLTSLLFAVPMFIANILFAVSDDSWVSRFFFVSLAAFSAYVAALLIQGIFSHKSVDTALLIHSICVYFLMVVTFAMLHGLVDHLSPGSYNIVGASGDVRNHLSDLFYFSVVTLTTLGYGDFLPLSQAAKTLVSIEALTGQLYLTVIVARLVGLHIAT